MCWFLTKLQRKILILFMAHGVYIYVCVHIYHRTNLQEKHYSKMHTVFGSNKLQITTQNARLLNDWAQKTAKQILIVSQLAAQNLPSLLISHFIHTAKGMGMFTMNIRNQTSYCIWDETNYTEDAQLQLQWNKYFLTNLRECLEISIILWC